MVFPSSRRTTAETHAGDEDSTPALATAAGGSVVGVSNTYPALPALRRALFEWSLNGIRATGEVYPLGGFLLAGAMIDTLAGLAYDPRNDADGEQGKRYERFVHEYFRPEYRANQLGSKMWTGLRCLPLHNFSAGPIVFADSQPDKGLHLRDEPDDRVVLHWPDFLTDYIGALERYWQRLESDASLREAAAGRCRRYPPFTVVELAVPPSLTHPVVGASAFSGEVAAASGAVKPPS